jgi:AcrR family transcriptional regulator
LSSVKLCHTGPVAPSTKQRSRAASASPSEAPGSTLLQLPLADAPRTERADAARNRERILTAARRLFAERGPQAVAIEDVAREAGVAKGTVFHRFGDRSGLLFALLDEHEREFQDRILRGPPPLGPGAPPRERLEALCAGLLDLLDAHGEILYASETAKPGARYESGAYQAWHQHAANLIREARPAADAEILADLLLAPFAAELHRHLTVRGVGGPRLRAAVNDVVARALG